MSNFRFRSVTVQLVLLFVAALMLFELMALGYRYVGRSNSLTTLEAVRIADHIAVVWALVDGTPREQRATTLAPFQGSDLYVYWRSDKPPEHKASSEQETNLLRDLLTKIIPELTAKDVIVGYEMSDNDALTLQKEGLATLWQKSGPFSEPIEDIVKELAGHPTYFVSIRLSDGGWLNFLAAYVDTIDFWPLRSLALLILLVFGVVGLSIWAIQRLTSPFRVFALAATRLATDVNAAPIKEVGPSEVREAARVFNNMQNKLQRFVADRTKMLAAISHDLRTPITRLRLRAECIVERELRAKCLRDLGEMEEMINGVLTFAKEDALSEPRTTVDLRAMVQSICDDLNDRGYVISLKESARMPFNCKRGSVRRCFTNVLENAVKHGVEAEVSIEHRCSEIRVVVEDRGPGIPKMLQEDVFQPFFRIEDSRSRDSGGCGLGLTVARTIARAHGGDVRIMNRPNGGLTTTIFLPMEKPSSVKQNKTAVEPA